MFGAGDNNAAAAAASRGIGIFDFLATRAVTNDQTTFVVLSFSLLGFDDWILDVSARVTTDHPLGSIYGREVSRSGIISEDGRFAEVSVLALTNVPGAFASAEAAALVQVFPDSSGYLSMASQLQTGDSYAFPNSPATAKINIAVELDGKRADYRGFASGAGFSTIIEGVPPSLWSGQDLLINRFVGSWGQTYEFAAIWHLVGTPAPGSSPGKPLGGGPTTFSPAPPIPVAEARPNLLGDDDLADEPQEITGNFLVSPQIFIAPVVDDDPYGNPSYGIDDEIFFGNVPEPADEPPVAAMSMSATAESGAARSFGAFGEPVAKSDYFFLSSTDNPNFSSFVLADLDPASQYTIVFGETTLEVAGGELVDFTAVVPEGVSAFLVRGLSEHSGAGIPHVFGATFASAGTAHFAVARVIPEPSSMVLLLAAVSGQFNRRRRRFPRSTR